MIINVQLMSGLRCNNDGDSDDDNDGGGGGDDNDDKCWGMRFNLISFHTFRMYNFSS